MQGGTFLCPGDWHYTSGLCSLRTYQCPSQSPASQSVALDKLPFDCVTTATSGGWLNFPNGPGLSLLSCLKGKKKVSALSFCVFPLLGWQSTQAEC